MSFPIGGPLEPNLYLQTYFEIFGPTNVNEQMNEPTNKQTEFEYLQMMMPQLVELVTTGLL